MKIKEIQTELEKIYKACDDCRVWEIQTMLSKVLKKMDNIPSCATCGKQMEMAYDSILKKKSKYLWKHTCKCVSPNVRLAIL